MKSLREVMDGMDWSGWATKPHGATQLPRPTADNYSRPVEGEGMNKAEEMASLTRGWLDLLRNPQRIASARACLEQALEAARQEGEARGFARARERAAVEAHAYMSALATHALVTLRSDADAVAGRIRAMQDESAGEVRG